LELTYNNTLQKADLIIKEEGARQLRLRILLLENENDDLHEQLALADDQIDLLEQGGEETRSQLEQALQDYRQQESELRLQTREARSLRAELNAMNGVTMDSTKVLTEKLALARELATLKPELEHLRSQTSHQNTLLSEKLALQRQVSTLEVELETEKRASKRATEKNKNKDREFDMQQQVDDLQKELAREKREREKDRKEAEKEFEEERRALKRTAEKGNNNKERVLELEQQVEELQEEIVREKRETEKIRKDLEKNLDAAKRTIKNGAHNERDLELERQVEKLEEELDEVKRDAEKTRKRLEKDLDGAKRLAEKGNSKKKDPEMQAELDSLKSDFAHEKREKDKARKDAERELNASETQRTVLESKLDQMKTKLRATKEELKECQAELTQVRAVAVKKASTSIAPVQNPRKRGAMEMSTDDNIGTPDGVAIRGKRQIAKRGRIDQTLVGEKSMFSITPFLNRTINMALDSPAEDEDKEDEGEEQPAANLPTLKELQDDPPMATDASPSVQPKPKAKKKPSEKVLGEAKSSTANKKPALKKSRTINTLERVAEEVDDENEELAPFKTQTQIFKPQAAKPLKVQLKTIEESEPEPKKKKRKLLSGSKTLFDEEDGEATKRPAKITLGPPRLLGKGGLAGPKGGLKGGLGAAGGFGAFSPLKKDKRGIGASFLG
jgi:hypothetical protein